MIIPRAIEQYGVKEILQQPSGSYIEDHLRVGRQVASRMTDLALAQDVDVHISLVRLDSGIDVKLDSAPSIVTVCARCGKSLTISETSQSEEEYVPFNEALDNQNSISPNLTINLGQQIIDTIGLSLPIRVLCRENCQGLCVICGVDLNEKPNHFVQKPDHKDQKPLANSIKIV